MTWPTTRGLSRPVAEPDLPPELKVVVPDDLRDYLRGHVSNYGRNVAESERRRASLREAIDVGYPRVSRVSELIHPAYRWALSSARKLRIAIDGAQGIAGQSPVERSRRFARSEPFEEARGWRHGGA